MYIIDYLKMENIIKMQNKKIRTREIYKCLLNQVSRDKKK